MVWFLATISSIVIENKRYCDSESDTVAFSPNKLPLVSLHAPVFTSSHHTDKQSGYRIIVVIVLLVQRLQIKLVLAVRRNAVFGLK